MFRDLRRRELPRELREAARPRVLLARVAQRGLRLLEAPPVLAVPKRYEVREGGEVLRGSTFGRRLGAFFGGLLARRLLGRVVAARRALLLLRVARLPRARLGLARARRRRRWTSFWPSLGRLLAAFLAWRAPGSAPFLARARARSQRAAGVIL